MPKLDPDGDWVWAKAATGQKVDQVTGIGVIPGDPGTIPQTPATVIIGGHYQCQLRFYTPADDPEPAFDQTLGQGGSCPNNSYPSQHFVAAMDSDGRWRWVFDDGANGSNATRILDLDISEDGRAMLLGTHSGEITIGGTNLPATSAGGAEFDAVEGNWQVTSDTYANGVGTMFIPNTSGVAFNRLRLSRSFNLSNASSPHLEFAHKFQLDEANGGCFDVATLDYSTDGGVTWSRFPGSAFTQGGYNGSGKRA